MMLRKQRTKCRSKINPSLAQRCKVESALPLIKENEKVDMI